jgi:preprotein translocase subunit SecB
VTADIGNVPPSLAVSGQYVKSLSFRSLRRPATAARADEPTEYAFGIEVDTAQLGPQSFEVTISLRTEMRHNGKASLVVRFVYAGIFVVTGMPPEAVEPTLHIVGAGLLFPFMQKRLNRLLFANGLSDSVGSFDFVEFYHNRHGTSPPI